MSEPVLYRATTAIQWHFAKGDRVYSPDRRWIGTVVQQRFTNRDIMPPLFEYLVEAPGGPCVWYDEPDLLLCQDTPGGEP